ncbi:MAG: E2/UBC family protein [Streptococcus sp.]
MYFDEIPSEYFESEDKECYFYQYKKFTLKIIVSNDFPHSPSLKYTFQIIRVLINWYSHVGSEGKLCYISEDNLIWDFNNPSGLLKDCCEKVKELLDSWDTPKMTEELRKEFLSYWHISCLKSKTKYIAIRSYLSRVSTFEDNLNLVLSD